MHEQPIFKSSYFNNPTPMQLHPSMESKRFEKNIADSEESIYKLKNNAHASVFNVNMKNS